MEGATQEPSFLERIRARKKKANKAEEEAHEPRHGAMRENFVSIVVCAVFAFFITTYVVHPMTVPTASMEPTILVGDRLLVDKFTVRNAVDGVFPAAPEHSIQRGDIVVFKHPTEIENLWVKRVIGLPGEMVEVRAREVFIDGQPLEEPYAQFLEPRSSRYSRGDFYGPRIVPEGHYFVLGDNRDNSRDSRFWDFLSGDLIVGRPLVIFWSYEDRPNAHEISGLVERLKLYGERVLYFFARTRWSRMGGIVG